MIIDELTLHWLAALLESEGSFCIGTPSHPQKPYIAIQMSDEEVIAKVAAIWSTKYHVSCPKRSSSKGWQSIYATRLTSGKYDVVASPTDGTQASSTDCRGIGIL